MHLRKILAAGLLSALLPMGLAAASVSINLGTIMPLGDSITDGSVPGGYRDPLYTDLTNAGYSFSFVGSATDNSTTLLTDHSDQHHEGNSGYVIENKASQDPNAGGTGDGGIMDNVDTWLGSGGANPNYILLMIGTNDVRLDYYLSEAPSRLSTLISMISDPKTGLRPNAKLIVAQITPFGSGSVSTNTEAQAFNAAIPGIVATDQAAGMHVSYVNMYGALNPSTDIGSDNIHPVQSGYNKMATVWLGGIEAAVPEPVSAGIVLVGAGMLLGRRTRARQVA